MGQRLTNVHTAPVAGLAPGETGEVDVMNPGVRIAIEARLLRPEGELIASRAAALVDAPSMADLAMLRTENARLEVVVADMRRREDARAVDAQRVDVRFGEMAEARASLQRDLDAARARIADLEAHLATATATAPSGEAGPSPAVPPETPTDPSHAPRPSRRG